MDALTRLETVTMSDVMNIADIAVLKSEVAGLHDAINEVSTKMDLVLSMRVELSVQGERLEQAVVESGRIRDALNKDIGQLEVKTENLAVHSKNTRTKLDAWLNRIAGGVFVGTVLMGVLQYVVLGKLNDLERMASIVSHNTAQIDLITRAIKSGAVDVEVDDSHANQANKELYEGAPHD